MEFALVTFAILLSGIALGVGAIVIVLAMALAKMD